MIAGKTDAQRLLKYAKDRATKVGIPFNLTEADIEIPELCPVLGVRLQKGKGGRPCAASPSLDRIVPELGYIRGNVIVVSRRANLLKNDASIGELSNMAAFYRGTVKKKFMKSV